MKSPLTGTVVERTVTPGQSVGGDVGQVLFTVADLSGCRWWPTCTSGTWRW
ncbi:MAG: hypothetical protein U0361_23160 [Nitrospiraceae bacterium]